ncbi:hypothetical protein OROHE_010889 [Orobanche hederae]
MTSGMHELTALKDVFEEARIDMGKSAIEKEVVEKAGRSVWDRIAPGLASQFDWPCTVPAIAPRPLLILNGAFRKCDNGLLHRKLFFTFTLYNTSNHNDRLKLGVTSSEEAVRSRKRFYGSLSVMIVSKRIVNKRSIDWRAASSTHVNAMTSDVIAPSLWKIFGCQNGLHLFKEPKDRDSNGRGNMSRLTNMYQIQEIYRASLQKMTKYVTKYARGYDCNIWSNCQSQARIYVRIIFRGEKRKTKIRTETKDGEKSFTFMLEEAPVKGRIHVEVLSTSTRIGLLHPKETLSYVDISLPHVVSNRRINDKFHLIDSKNG